jgi:hypothetical protein
MFVKKKFRFGFEPVQNAFSRFGHLENPERNRWSGPGQAPEPEPQLSVWSGPVRVRTEVRDRTFPPLKAAFLGPYSWSIFVFWMIVSYGNIRAMLSLYRFFGRTLGTKRLDP